MSCNSPAAPELSLSKGLKRHMEEYYFTLNGKLSCSGEYDISQPQIRARCAVWFSMTNTVVYWSQSFIQDSRRQDESCRKKILDLTELSPLAHIPAWQL